MKTSGVSRIAITNMSVLHDPPLERLLAKLHAESDAQNPAIRDHYDELDRSVGRQRIRPLEPRPF